jgi:hypothetical protein
LKRKWRIYSKYEGLSVLIIGGIMLNEKKPRLALTGAIVILSLCILISAFSISNAIRESSRNNSGNGTYEYELNRFNENFEELIKTLQENN